MDRRIDRTLTGIRTAFLQLREKKPLESLTVRELCERAGINKSTFYVYYRDVYDLSDKVEWEIVREIMAELGEGPDVMDDPRGFTRRLITAYTEWAPRLERVFSGIRTEQLPRKVAHSLKEMLASRRPELMAGGEMEQRITYSVYGGYFVYRDHRPYGEEETIDRIVDWSERLFQQKQ